MDLATASSAPRDITLAGKVYKVAPLSFRDLGKTVQWIKDNTPSPTDRVAKLVKSGVPHEALKELFRQAYMDEKDWPPRFGTIEWIQAFDFLEGIAFLLGIGLRKTHIGITDAEIELIADDMTIAELSSYLDAISGVSPDPKDISVASSEVTTEVMPVTSSEI